VSASTPQGPYAGPPSGPFPGPSAGPPASAPATRRPALLAGALVAAAILLGGGFVAGRVTAPKDPATLAVAFQEAAQGKLPCGSTGGQGGGALLARACTARAGAAGGAGGFGGGRGGANRGGGLLGPGSVTGQVTQVSGSQLTVSTNAGALTVKLSPSTAVLKTGSGRPSDLTDGARVVVASTANADGSRVAQRILLLPATGSQG
jgi:Domain of unknown function (DUF5666)